MITHELGVLHGHQPHDGYGRDQNLGVRLVEVLVVGVPSATFNEETVDEGTIVGLFARINTLGVRDDLEVVLDGIDGDLILSGIVLLHTSKETVSEMEARNPEDSSGSVINPALVLLESLHQVDNERSKRFEGVIRPLLPLLGYDVIEQPCGNFFELLRHDDFSLNGTTNVNQGRPDGHDQSVVTE